MIDNEPMKLVLTPRFTSGNDVLSISELSKAFDSKTIFENMNLEIKKGDKVALVGPNGVGKTTVFRMILGNMEPTSGVLKLGANVVVGYYDQEHATLNTSNTIMVEIESAFPDLKQGEIRNVLAAFLFTSDDVFKPISTLSGGEKGRVALAKIMLSKANFLILDEPTNHLDIISKEILESAILNYEGTVLYVSHDRYFINQTADKVIDMSRTGTLEYLGNYDYFVEKKKTLTSPSMSGSTTTTSASSETTANKMDWQKQKEEQTKKRRIQSQINKIEEAISLAEERIEYIDSQLCLEEIYSNYAKSSELMTEKESLNEKISSYYEEWEELSDSL